MADLTVRATDTDGNYCETTFTVTVYPVNDPPEITGFTHQVAVGYYQFYGTVSDVDDNVTGMTVTFGGVLEPYNLTATVNSDGSFYLAGYFSFNSGDATVYATDDSGDDSDIVWQYVIGRTYI